ncbi:MAG TPA: translation initiation factor IF-2 [Candidatus Saccharimonadales bacterium]|nr:translation initiation factor IF-2 [Candidatus Saccharimonadales bacterium]
MEKKTLMVGNMITVGELAAQLDLPVTKLIGELFKNGIMATVNQRIDIETAQIIVDELGLEVELKQKAADETKPAAKSARTLTDKAQERPPIVAVMGHVDHGKTSLLDAVLDTKVASGEAGGITQHISAYQTQYKGRTITLLDTPGHEAFSALRQHGAALTDVVVIVVAADDGVKPQTVEAIRFARQANAQIIVALNKIDKPDADVNRVKQQLATDHNLMTEEWGGDTVMVEVSAKTKQGIDKLLEMILLVADIEELKAEVDVPAEGLIIESHMEQGKGAVVGLLVEHGILKPGNFIVAGESVGKIRTLGDFASRPIKQAGPSTPVVVSGFKTLPEFGERFTVVKSEKEARTLAEKHKQSFKDDVQASATTSSDLLNLMNRRKEKQLVNFIVRADVQGSLTSVVDSLKLLERDEVAPRIISSGVGNISENDVRMAAGSQAVIYGFNVQLPPAVKKLAARDKVEVKLYKIIYELLEDATLTLENLLAPDVVETEIGKLTVKGVFKITKDQAICGGEITKGKVEPKLLVRIKRGDEQIAEAEVSHVQREKMEVKEAFEGDMCGLSLDTKGKVVVEEGDKLEFFKRELVKRKL